MNGVNRIGYFRCPHCGENYHVEGDLLDKDGEYYHCNKCGNDFDVPFFMFCSHCNKIVGVEQTALSDILWGMAENVLVGMKNPLKAVSFLRRVFDDVPSGNSWGICKYCNTTYIRCHKCNSPIEVKPGTGDNDILFCPKCGQKNRQP